jgi:hypothetical protein
LEKLFGARSFGGFIGHLVCCQTIFFTSMGGLNLPSMVKNYCPPIFGVLGIDCSYTYDLFPAI